MLQLLITLLFATYLFDNIAKIGLPNIFVYGIFIFLTVYSYSELMDKKKFSFLWETIRFVFALAIINYYGDWFGLNSLISFGNYLVVGYLTLSMIITLYFTNAEFKVQNQIILNQ